MNTQAINQCVVEPLEVSRISRGAAPESRKRWLEEFTEDPELKLPASKMYADAVLPRKRRRVHFPEQTTTTTRLVESRQWLTGSDRSALWVQRSEVVETLRNVSSTVEECFLASSAAESATYVQCLAATYLHCCTPQRNEEQRVDATSEDDDASLIQEIQSQTRALAQGGAVALKNTSESPLQSLRGLETQVLPELGNERCRRRLEHVSCLVQLHRMVRDLPEGDALTGAISHQLSRPSRRFAAVLGTVDALAVEQDCGIETNMQQESQELADLSLSRPARGATITEGGTKRRHPDGHTYYNSQEAQSLVHDNKKALSAVLAGTFPSLTSDKKQKCKAFVPPSA